MAPSTDFSGADIVSSGASYDTSKLADKSVVITGAGSGLGEAFLREYVKAGAFVTFGDFADDRSKAIVDEIGEDKVCFVHCDVTNWQDQLHLFHTALEKSPSKTIDIVVANAGTSGHDDLATDDTEPDGEPKEPNVNHVKIDLIGVLYTTKLALHYFPRQTESPDRDRCLILTSSIAGYVDKPGSPQYNAAKFGVRGLMRCLRTTMPEQKMRVNLLAPWFIPARIIPEATFKHMRDRGVDFADKEDATAAAMCISCDSSINGRAIAVIPRAWGGEGFVDLQQDDYQTSGPMAKCQAQVLQI